MALMFSMEFRRRRRRLKLIRQIIDRQRENALLEVSTELSVFIELPL